MVQASLRICANSPEPSELAYTKYGLRPWLRPKLRPVSSLDTPACAFIRGIYAYAISTQISCAGSIIDL